MKNLTFGWLLLYAANKKGKRGWREEKRGKEGEKGNLRGRKRFLEEIQWKGKMGKEVFSIFIFPFTRRFQGKGKKPLGRGRERGREGTVRSNALQNV